MQAIWICALVVGFFFCCIGVSYIRGQLGDDTLRSHAEQGCPQHEERACSYLPSFIRPTVSIAPRRGTGCRSAATVAAPVTSTRQQETLSPGTLELEARRAIECFALSPSAERSAVDSAEGFPSAFTPRTGIAGSPNTGQLGSSRAENRQGLDYRRIQAAESLTFLNALADFGRHEPASGSFFVPGGPLAGPGERAVDVSHRGSPSPTMAASPATPEDASSIPPAQ